VGQQRLARQRHPLLQVANIPRRRWAALARDNDHFRLWPYDKAPEELQALRRNLKAPAWVLFSPDGVGTREREDLLMQLVGVGIERYQLPDGIIYLIA
jgi:hypothetical protein